MFINHQNGGKKFCACKGRKMFEFERVNSYYWMLGALKTMSKALNQRTFCNTINFNILQVERYLYVCKISYIFISFVVTATSAS